MIAIAAVLFLLLVISAFAGERNRRALQALRDNVPYVEELERLRRIEQSVPPADTLRHLYGAVYGDHDTMRERECLRTLADAIEEAE